MNTRVRKRVLIAFALATTVALTTAPSHAADPTFAFETTVDGYYLASGRGMVVDDAGNSYTYAAHYLDGVRLDILLVKLDPEGDLVWEQVIAGSEHDYATGILLDDDENIWLAGWTDSEDFPVTPDALDGSLTGFRDVFLLQLSADDGSVMYGTYVGGDYTDQARDIALGENGEIYLVGATQSTDFPTVDPLQAEPGSYPYSFSDAFIMRLSPDGKTILYSTYFGGGRDDVGGGIAVGSEGQILIAGSTDSRDFPLQDPLQASLAGNYDLFVAEISADGSALEFSSYLGGEDWDFIAGLARDANDNLYIGGSTRSLAFPTTPGAFQEEYAGEPRGCEVPFGEDYNCEDMFVTKIVADRGAYGYSTYIGGESPDEMRDIDVDALGRVHLVGATKSADFPPHGIDTAAEIAVVSLSADGSALEFVVTVDSNTPGAGHGLALGELGEVYFSGAMNAPADVYIAKLWDGEQSASAPGEALAAAQLWLGRAAPNPSASTARLDFVLPGDSASHARLSIYDASGRHVRTLVDGVRTPGPHNILWDGADRTGEQVSAGVYYYELRWDGENRTQRMLRLR
jgi:hypothetical protein